MDEATRALLANYWYPVALSSEVRDKPVAARLLDKQVVLWRSGGSVNAFNDLCIHRGTRLSLGWIQGDELVPLPRLVLWTTWASHENSRHPE